MHVSFRGKLLKLNKPIIIERYTNLLCIHFLALMNFYFNQECFIHLMFLKSLLAFFHSQFSYTRKSTLLFYSLLWTLSVQCFCHTFCHPSILKSWANDACKCFQNSKYYTKVRVYTYVTVIIRPCLVVAFALPPQASGTSVTPKREDMCSRDCTT